MSQVEEQLAAQVAALDWSALGESLEQQGFALTPALLSEANCRDLLALYQREQNFRKRVVMERMRFGRGEYRYFGAPLPALVEELRASFYPPLARIANRWQEWLGAQAFPPDLPRFLALCAQHGQERPTPLMLRYEAGGFNCLHQDLYGEVVFPLQVTLMLSRAGSDYEGGEFLLVEDRPRAQARGAAIALAQGQAVIFPSSRRPVRGARGYVRARMRHGVSPLRHGLRYALGIIFHDAR